MDYTKNDYYFKIQNKHNNLYSRRPSYKIDENKNNSKNEKYERIQITSNKDIIKNNNVDKENKINKGYYDFSILNKPEITHNNNYRHHRVYTSPPKHDNLVEETYKVFENLSKTNFTYVETEISSSPCTFQNDYPLLRNRKYKKQLLNELESNQYYSSYLPKNNNNYDFQDYYVPQSKDYYAPIPNNFTSNYLLTEEISRKNMYYNFNVNNIPEKSRSRSRSPLNKLYKKYLSLTSNFNNIPERSLSRSKSPPSDAWNLTYQTTTNNNLTTNSFTSIPNKSLLMPQSPPRNTNKVYRSTMTQSTVPKNQNNSIVESVKQQTDDKIKAPENNEKITTEALNTTAPVTSNVVTTMNNENEEKENSKENEGNKNDQENKDIGKSEIADIRNKLIFNYDNYKFETPKKQVIKSHAKIFTLSEIQYELRRQQIEHQKFLITRDALRVHREQQLKRCSRMKINENEQMRRSFMQRQGRLDGSNTSIKAGDLSSENRRKLNEKEDPTYTKENKLKITNSLIASDCNNIEDKSFISKTSSFKNLETQYSKNITNSYY